MIKFGVYVSIHADFNYQNNIKLFFELLLYPNFWTPLIIKTNKLHDNYTFIRFLNTNSEQWFLNFCKFNKIQIILTLIVSNEIKTIVVMYKSN